MKHGSPFSSVAVLSFTLLFPAYALSADVTPVPAPLAPLSPAPVIPYSWTGFYIGAHLGWGWTDSEWDQGAHVTSSEGSGFLAGVQGGLNYQLTPNWLVGLEGQFSWTGIEGKGKLTEDINWLTTIGPRFGYDFGGGFVYAKGGVAWAGIDLLADPPLHAFSDSETKTGWFIGAGIEHVLWGQFSAKLEYSYINFGSTSVTLTGLPTDASVDVDQDVHVVKGGINYRFGGLPW